MTTDQTAQWQRLIDADAEVQRASQAIQGFQRQYGGAYGTRNPTVGPQAQWQAVVRSAKAKYGIPDDYEISYEGGRPTVQQRSWMDKHGKTLSNTIIGTGAALTGLGAAGLFGGGAAGGGGAMAAEGVAPFSGLPGGFTAEGALASTPWTMGAGTMSAVPQAGAWDLPTAAGEAAGGASAASALSKLGFGWDDLIKLGIGGATAIGAATGSGNDDMPPEIRELLNLQKQRLMAGNPLYESVLRLAFSRLPTNATQGLTIPPIGG